jgi:predicted methyltransferase
MKLNLPNGVLLGTISLLVSMPLVADAQTNNFQYPQPNQKGDYTSILSNQAGQKSPHLVWKVVSSELNCRAQAGRNYRVVRSLWQGDNVDVVGQPKIYLDKQGKPWLYVAKEGNAEDLKIRCFVRANSQLIKPIPYSKF